MHIRYYVQTKDDSDYFFHDELLRNRAALNYQTKERGHSLETLKDVGFVARRSIIAHAKKHGYTPQDLVAIGLVKEAGGSFQAVIPSGFYVYSHTVQGEVLFFSLKDPRGKFKFQIKKI